MTELLEDEQKGSSR